MPELADAHTMKVAEWRLVAYVEVCLRRYAANWRRKQHRRAGYEMMLLNAPVAGEGSDAVEFVELLSGAAAAEEDYLQRAPLEEVLTDRTLYQAFSRLTPHQRRVLMCLVLGGVRQQTLASRLTVTQQAVCRTKTKALQRLRAAAEGR